MSSDSPTFLATPIKRKSGASPSLLQPGGRPFWETSMMELSEESRFKSELVALIPRLRAYAQSLCRNRSDADDLTQAALTKAWDNRAQYQDGTT